MRCRRQGRVLSSLSNTLFVRAGFTLLLLFMGANALADSTVVYDPFEVPQGAYQAAHVEDVENVSIIEFAGNYDKKLPSGETNAAARAVVAREFYRTHADDYDFLVVFSDFEFNTGDATAFYNPVRNDTQGIGLPQFDLSSIYGSEGKLQGYIDMAALSRYELDPLKPSYERGLLVLAHEFFHRWGVFVRFIDEQGQLNNSLLGRQDAHWSFKVDTSASVQYGHDWHDQEDGSFKAHSARRFFSPMDLYLMGLYGPDEVEPFYYIESEDRSREELPQPGVSISGVAKQVTVEDIIAAEGPRVPGADASQKEFKFAFIYLKSASAEVDSSTLLALKRFRENFVTRLSILTGGRSVANVYPQAKPLGDIGESEIVEGGELRNSATSVPEALAWLRNAQASEGYWEDQKATRLRDTALLLDTLTTYDPSFQRIDDAESWLRRQDSLDTDSLARRFEIRRSEQEREGDLNALLDRRNADGGWGVREGYQSDVMDTALVLRATAPHLGGEVKSAAVNYLLEQQGQDGGWPTVEASASQVTVTALAMDALREAGIGGEPVLNAVEFLKARQLPDGGFGSSTGTVHDTAHVIVSLLRAGYLQEIDVAGAAAYLSGQQSTAGDWNGSVYSTALAVSALQSANFANWLIDDVLADPESPRDGERVKLTVTVANDGQEATDATILRVYEGGTVDPANLISDDLRVPSIPPRNAVSVDYYWDSIDKSGTAEFTFAVDPDEAVVERSELDNIRSFAIDVREAPEGVDLELNDGAVSVTPAAPYYLPSDLSVSLSIRNAGTEPAEGALVRLFRIEDGAEPVVVGEKVVSIPARQTSVVNFVDRLETTGTTLYQAVADPDSAIEEADETNNTGTASVTPRDTIDFVVNDSSVSMQPLTAFVNEDAQFTVVIRNQGSLPAPPSTVRYSLVSEGQEQVLRTNNIVLDAAESVVQTLDWRVDSAGPKQLIVEMDPDQTVSETDESNNRFAFQFDAQVLQGTNLGVSFSDITASPQPLLEGYGATLSAEIKNNGTETVNGVVVQFFNGNPEDGGTEIGTTTIGTIDAAERVTASVVWNQVPDSSEKLIYVGVDPADAIAEFDETDNLAFQRFHVQALPDFVLGEGSLKVTPAFPKQGQSAEIRVDFNNAGTQAGEDVVVNLYEGDPLTGGVLIGSQTLPIVEGQGTGTATFDYQFSDTAETVLLVATTNEARAIQEKDYSNNTAKRSLTIQNNNFHVSERYISPDGDDIKDVSRFSFRLETQRDVVISVTNSNGREVRRFTGEELLGAESGSVEWDGRNEFGGIVNDDEYTLSVVDSSGSVLGSAIVHVDTNRSSLLKAVNTPYERITDLRSLLTSDGLLSIDGTPTYASNDELAFFMGRPYDSADAKGYVTGIYRSTVYGGQLTALVDFASIPELSRANYLSDGPFISPKNDTLAFRTNSDVWSVNIEGGPVRHLLASADLSVDYNDGSFTANWEKLFYSHDGEWLFFFKRFDNRLELGRIRVDGAGLTERLSVLDDYHSVEGVWRSPSSDNFYAMLGSSNGGYHLVHFGQGAFDHSLIEEFGYDRPSSGALEWAPDGRIFAVGDRRYAGLSLLSPSGAIIERKAFFDLDSRFEIPEVRWNPNSLELAYEVNRKVEVVPTVSSAPGEGELVGDLCDSLSYQPVSGVYIWNTVTGKTNRPIAVTEQAVCDSGYGERRALETQVVDIRDPELGFGFPAYFTDETDQFWLYEAPSDWEWSPGERRIIVRIGNTQEMPSPAQLLVVDIEALGSFEEIFTDWPYGWVNDIDISPTGRRMFIDDVAFESLLNLSLDLRALRSRAAGGVQLSGTAADLNFEHYKLEYALNGENREWKSVRPDSLIPLVDGEMAVWVPPAPGSYYVRLTGKDRAGNERSSLKRTSWGEQAALTDLYRDPGYISPNGDGIQDGVNIHMRILQPVNLALEVYSEEGELVRTIRRSFDLIGAQHNITWDGRDDYGSVVPDGRYRLDLGKYRYSVVVDSTPPEITMGAVPDLLVPTCNRQSPFCVPFVTLNTGAGYSFVEENYYRFRIEREGDGSIWTVLSKGEFSATQKVGALALAINDLNSLGLAHRLVVEDLAGNQAIEYFDLTPKRNKAILDRAGRHRGDRGRLLPIQEDPNVPYAVYDSFPEDPSGLEFDLARFRMIESVQAPIESVSMLYREVEQSDSEWKELLVTDFGRFACPPFDGYCSDDEKKFVNGAREENGFTFLVNLAPLNPATTYELKGKLVDKDGVVSTTNGLILTQTYSFKIESIKDLGDRSYQVKTMVMKAPFEIFDHFIRISSTEDPRYFNATKIETSEKTFRTIDLSNPIEVVEGFFIDDAIPCAAYELEYVLVDEFGNEVATDPVKTNLGCTQLYYKVSPTASLECGAEPPRELQLSAGIFRGDGFTPAVYQLLVWELFEDGSDTPRTLFTKNNPDLDKFYDFTLDTSVYEEGAYDVRIRAVKDSGEEISKNIRLPVDHTAPEVSVMSPESGSKVCAIAFQKPNDNIVNGALINADILDIGGTAFEYEMTYQKGVGSPSSKSSLGLNPSADMSLNAPLQTNYPPLLAALEQRVGQPKKALRFAGSNQPLFAAPARMTLSGNLKALGDAGLILLDDANTVSFQLAVTDSGGYRQCVSQSFYLDAAVEGFAVSSRTNIISPNGDGHLDQAVLDLALGEDASVSIAIHDAYYDSKTNSYKSVDQPLFSVFENLQFGVGTSALEWDGTDGASVVPDGHYFMAVEVRDACGNTEREEFLVEVDATPPATVIHYPKTGNPISLTTEVLGSVSDLNLVSYRLEYSVEGDGTWAFIADGRRNISESLLANWNTFGLKGGIDLRLVAKDRAGNETAVIESLNISERTDLLSYVDLSALYVSPNGDSVLDSVRLNVGVLESVELDVNLLQPDGERVSTLISGAESEAGEYTYAWDGVADGDIVADGSYKLEVIARSLEFAGLQQTETTTVIVDTQAPELLIRGIENGFARTSLTAAITDLHLKNYTYFKTDEPDSPAWMEMLTDDESETNKLLEPLAPDNSEEGDFGLRLVARDLAGNSSELVMPYIVDFTPPSVEITAPAMNAVTGALWGNLEVTGAVEDLYFAEYTVSFQSEDGSFNRELLTASSLPATDLLATIAVDDLVEGPGSLIVEARDASGQVTLKNVSVLIDNTPPSVELSQPGDGSYITGPKPIVGSIQDQSLESYVVEIATGHNAANDAAWTNLVQGTREVVSGNVAYLSDLPVDGEYTVRIKAVDQVGQESKAHVNVIIDTTPPEAPILSTLDAEKGRGVDITWEPVADSDLAGYVIQRGGDRQNTDLETDITYLDSLEAEGVYEYRIVAVDQAGNESVPSGPKQIRVDWTPPEVALSNPIGSSVNSGLVNIRGTAFSEDDFAEYELAVGVGAVPQGWQVIEQSPLSLQSSELAQWDTLVMADGEEYTLRLKATDLSGNENETSIVLSIDNTAPDAPKGLLAKATGSDVELTWDANSETDFAGYYLFSEGSLVNADVAVIGDMSPYLLIETSYIDDQKPDGTYEYYLYAADSAGNVSESSEPAEVTIETQAPHVEFDRPVNLDGFENTLTILADTRDNDISVAEFVYRVKDSEEWISLRSVNGSGPYSLAIDTTSFAYGDYQISAVATDVNGNVDPNPVIIEVSKVDLTRPAKVVDLHATTDGSQVSLSWVANSESDLAGYFVERSDQSGNTVRLNSDPVSATVFTDQNVSDGQYDYSVYAVDMAGNESARSELVEVTVYTPVLAPIYTPTTEVNVALSGRTPFPVSGVADLSVQTILGTETYSSVALTGEGEISWPDVPLQPGENVMEVRVSDNAGNRSKAATYKVVRGEAPAAPQNLQASAQDDDVNLSWDANAESDIFGYLPYRGNSALINEVRSSISAAEGEAVYSYYSAYNAIDGNTSSYFRPRSEEKNFGNLTITLAERSLVSRFEMEYAYGTSYRPNDFNIEVWTGSAWLPVVSIVDGQRLIDDGADGPAEGFDLTLTKPYLTDRVRVSFTKLCGYYCRIGEFRVFQQPLLDLTTYTATNQGNGIERYNVTAVNSLGLESVPSEPAETVVGDIVPPAPVSLQGSVLNEHDVELTWQASSSLDALNYRIYRDGELLSIRSVADTSYSDINLKNGSYIYHVVVEDKVGNLSPASNQVSLTVAASIDSKPENVTVESIPAGEALRISWSHAKPDPMMFRVYRAVSASGTFDVIAESTTREILDEPLVNEREYFYRVAVVDEYGNESPSSDTVSGIPRDTVAPEPPVLVSPVSAGQVKEVERDTISLTGFAEPGAKVAAFLDGNMSVPTIANAQAVQNSVSFGSPLGSAVSPNGVKLLAANYSGFSVVDLETGESWAGDFELTNVVWVDTDLALGRSYNGLFAIDAENQTGSFVELQGAESYAIQWMDVSKALDKWILLVTSYEPSRDSGIWIVDPDTYAIERVIAMGDWGYAGESAALSPDGSQLVWQDSTVGKIGRLNLETGQRTTLGESASYSPDSISWNEAGNAFAFVESYNKVSIFDPSNGVKTPLALNNVNDIQSVYWTQKDRIVIVSSYNVYEYNLSSAATETIYSAEYYYERPTVVSWSDEQGVVSIGTRNASYIVEPAGRFKTFDIELHDGANQIFAIAQDEAGNESEPTDVSTLIYKLSDNPDLVVELGINPRLPLAGSYADLKVTISNSGNRPSTEFASSISVVSPDGGVISLWDRKPIPPLAAGASLVRSVEWPIPDLAGLYNLVATVDDNQVIREVSEANNSVISAVDVLNDGGVAIDVESDRDTYTSRQAFRGTLDIVNPGVSLDANLSAWIEDESGYEVVRLRNQPDYHLAASSVVQDIVSWNTGTIFAGNYSLVAQLGSPQGGPLAESRFDFVIEREVNPVLAVKSDKVSYGPNEDASITVFVSNEEANTSLRDLELVIRVVDDLGEVFIEEREAISELNPSDTQSLTVVWNTGNTAPGDLVIESVLMDSKSDSLESATNQITITKGRPVLPSELTVSDRLPVGELLVPTFTVSNAGNGTVNDLELSLSLVGLGDGRVISSQTVVTDLSRSASFGDQAQFQTADLPLGQYHVRLTASFQHEGIHQSQVLATRAVTLFDADAPQVSILNPTSGDVVNGSSAKVAISVEDRLSGVDTVEAQIDGGVWIELPAAMVNYYYDLAGLPEGVHNVAVRALDFAGNLSIPVSVGFTIDNQVPGISIQGVEPGVHYSTGVTPVVIVEDASLTRIEMDGKPFTSGSFFDEEGPHRLFAYAEDAAGNSVREELAFVIDRTQPEISIEGVSDEELYAEPVNIDITVFDAYLDSSEVLLNDVPYRSGELVSETGEYSLVVTASDKAGNTVRETRVFEIDTEAPEKPEVTKPADGDIIDNNQVPVVGYSEPQSVIDLNVTGSVYTTITDDTGTFRIGDLSLEDGTHVLRLTATDRAGNVSEETRLTITVRGKTQLDIQGEVTARSHVLVWIPEHPGKRKGKSWHPNENEFDNLIELIGSAYDLNGTDYQIVRNETDFITALRSQRFNVLLIGSLKPALGHPLKMSYATELEIRGVVGAGTGLVWINNHTNLFELWHDVIGARSFGALPHVQNIHLDDSPASNEGEWAYDGRHGVRVILTGGVGVGQLEVECKPHWHLWHYYSGCGNGWWQHDDEHKNPALVINKYGAGSVAMFTFNPGDLSEPDQAQSMITQVTSYATPLVSRSFDEAVVDIAWTITGVELGQNLAVLQELSEQLSLVSVDAGEAIDDKTAHWARISASTSVTVASQVRLSEENTEGSASLAVYEGAIGAGTLLAEGTLAVNGQQSRSDLEFSYMEAIESIDYSVLEYWPVHKAMIYAQSAVSRDLNSRAQIEWAIWDVKKSIAWLSHIDRSKAGDAIVFGGQLLQYYQALWHEATH